MKSKLAFDIVQTTLVLHKEFGFSKSFEHFKGFFISCTEARRSYFKSTACSLFVLGLKILSYRKESKGK